MSAYKPHFSVVIPVRNGAEYIALTVESVLKQTYPQFSLLILENFSEDETVSIITAYDDSRIAFFPAVSPLTIEENWGRILNLELAEYMTILGHDDLLYPSFLDEIAALIHENPEASLYHSHFHLIDEGGKLIRPCKPVPYRETAQDFLRARHLFQRDNYGTGYVMRSADYKKVGGVPQFPRLIYADDAAWYSLAQLASKACSPHYLFAYRYYEASTARQTDLLTLYVASKDYLRFLSQSDYFRSEANAALAYHFVQFNFHGRYHLLLLELIMSGNVQQLEKYKRIKEQLLREASVDRLFPVYDSLSWLLEFLAESHLPPLLKNLLLRVIEGARHATRSLRQKVPIWKQLLLALISSLKSRLL